MKQLNNCLKKSCAMSKKLTTQEWIEKAKLVHGEFYDYSKTVYINSDSRVSILCKEHGEFEQKAANHLQGKGCIQCGINKSAATKIKTQEQFVTEVRVVHNNKYSYECTEYAGIENKITVLCPLHGKFRIKANSHIQGHGCQMCRNETVKAKLKIPQNSIIKRFKARHGNKYDYSEVEYVDMHTKVKILCDIHGIFEQIPRAHLANQGCPSCAKTGFDNNKPAILYYLKIITEEGKELYKIGITNRTVNERFRLTDLAKIEIIKQEEFTIGTDAQDKEREILKKYKKYKYTGPKILDSGNTELFTEDVLALYYAKVN